jgi:hypothetical protein
VLEGVGDCHSTLLKWVTHTETIHSTYATYANARVMTATQRHWVENEDCDLVAHKGSSQHHRSWKAYKRLVLNTARRPSKMACYAHKIDFKDMLHEMRYRFGRLREECSTKPHVFKDGVEILLNIEEFSALILS